MTSVPRRLAVKKTSIHDTLPSMAPDDSEGPFASVSPLYRPSVILGSDRYAAVWEAFSTHLNATPTLPADSQKVEDFSVDGSDPLVPVEWPGCSWIVTVMMGKASRLLRLVVPTLSTDTDPTTSSDQYLLSADGGLPLSGIGACRDACLFLYTTARAVGRDLVAHYLIPTITKELYTYTQLGNCEYNSLAMTTGLFAGFCSVLSASHDKSDWLKMQKLFTNAVFLLTSEAKSLDGLRHAVMHLCYVAGSQRTVDSLIIPALKPCTECADVSVRRAAASLYLTATRQGIGCEDTPASDMKVIDGGVRGGTSTDTSGLVDEVISLSRDEDCTVRVYACASLLSLVNKSTSPEEKTKLFSRISGLMEESLVISEPLSQHQESQETVPSTSTVSHVSDDQRIMLPLLLGVSSQLGPASPESFRNMVLLPWLLRVTELNNACPIRSHREKVAMALYTVLSTLVYYVGDEGLDEFLVPALNRLKLDTVEVCPDYTKEVDFILADLRGRVERRRSSISSLEGGDLKAGFMNKLKDLRESGKTNRMTNISNISNLFTRKK